MARQAIFAPWGYPNAPALFSAFLTAGRQVEPLALVYGGCSPKPRYHCNYP